MKIFVYEHITGGGCLESAPSPSLAAEALLMVRALADDLADVPEIQVCGLRDSRLAFGPLDDGWVEVRSYDQWQERVDRLIRASEATWPIAPETGGALEEISGRVLQAERLLLGSRIDAVRVAASKLSTARLLQRVGVPAVPTCRLGSQPTGAGRAWVVKPDDGCGCEGVRWFDTLGAAVQWAEAQKDPGRCVLQPFIPGEPLSLSALAWDGQAQLLAVNRQRIVKRDGGFVYQGSIVNAFPDADGRMEKLAQQIAAAIPGLWGYFGVDLVRSDAGPVVLEVNPRLTTSYAGLRSALGTNPAALVLRLLRGDGFDLAQHPRTGAVGVDASVFQDAP